MLAKVARHKPAPETPKESKAKKTKAAQWSGFLLEANVENTLADLFVLAAYRKLTPLEGAEYIECCQTIRGLRNDS